jgi:DNA-binding NtrC family response regulator
MLAIRVDSQNETLVEVHDGDPGRLREVLCEPKCAHVLSNEWIDEVLRAAFPKKRCYTKNKNKGFASCIDLNAGGIQAVRTSYRSERRLLSQGLRPLLRQIPEEADTSILAGVPDALFEQMAQRLDDGEHPDRMCESRTNLKRTLLDLLPDIKPPANIHLEDLFRGHSIDAKTVRKLITITARADMPVLVLGPTGTGKGIVARAIHDCSKRSGDFITVNCAAIPPPLFESEVFGYVSGAFTNALKAGKKGAWARANNGTLFLDEIADLPIECQPKILHALEAERILPVGATEEVSVSARIIAATSRNLFRLVEQGLFREDLFHRLRRTTINTPPIETEGKELRKIIALMWADLSEKTKCPLSPQVIDMLAEQRWAGHFRDLKGFLEGLDATWPGQTITPTHVKALMHHRGPTPMPEPEDGANTRLAREIRRIERQHHLNRTAEILHAVQNAVAVLTRKNSLLPPDLESVITHRLVELDLMLHTPLRFGNGNVYEAVAAVRNSLAELCSLLGQDATQARTHARRRTVPVIKKALAVLFGAT